MVGPPSSWSRDQGESRGRLGQRTIRTAGVHRPCGRSLASWEPSIPLRPRADRRAIPALRQLAVRRLLHDRLGCVSGGETLFEAAFPLLGVWRLEGVPA